MPSIPGGDSGELVAEACELGTAHPPGYPLYTLVVHLITYIPYGTMAYRANFFCATCTAAACALLCSMVQTFQYIRTDVPGINYTWAGMLAGAMYGFSPLVWTYAVGSEVFALNNLFASLVLNLTAKYATAKARGGTCSGDFYMYVGALVCGLGMCNQHTLILYEIPLVCWILYTQYASGKVTVARTLALAVLFLVGLLPYIFLYWSDTYAMKKGSWGDSSNLKGFWRHLTRADYGTFQLFSGNDGREVEGLADRLLAHLKDFTYRQSLGFGPLPALFGLVHSLRNPGLEEKPASAAAASSSRKGKKKAIKAPAVGPPPIPKNSFGVALMGAYVFYQVGFHSLSNLPLSNPLLFGVHARFWMQPNLIVFAYFGIGIVSLATVVSASFPSFIKSNISSIVTVVVASLQFGSWFHNMDQSENWYLQNYANALLNTIPKNSLFLTNYDQQWTASRYLQICEKKRPDVETLNLSMMTFQWFHVQRPLYAPKMSFVFNGKEKFYLARMNSKQYKRGEAFSFKEFLDANIDRYPGGIYLGGKVGFNEEGSLKQHYEEVPYGMLVRFRKLDRTPPLTAKQAFVMNANVWKVINKALPSMPNLTKYTEETWESTVHIDYWDHVGDTATYVLDMIADSSCKESICTSSEENVMALAHVATQLELFVKSKNPDHVTASVYKNLGIAYSRIVQSKQRLPASAPYPFPAFLYKMYEGRPGGDDYKNHASYRTLDTWSKFLSMDGAKSDPAYPTIKNVVEYLSGVNQASLGNAPPARKRSTEEWESTKNAPKKSKKTKKKKSKKKRKKRS
jgi:hypothetical protein